MNFTIIMNRWMIKGVWGILLLFILGACTVLGLYTVMQSRYSSRIYKLEGPLPESMPAVAIVFGAGVWENNEPSPVLYDRVATAVELYKAGHVRKLLLTGDNRFENYNEPEAMKTLALKLGVPEGALILDYAGRRTYDSCYRAINVFAVTRATLITQEFHLPRCLYLCDALGIEAIGVSANRREYFLTSQVKWLIRETLALARAWYNINVKQPHVISGAITPIDETKKDPTPWD